MIVHLPLNQAGVWLLLESKAEPRSPGMNLRAFMSTLQLGESAPKRHELALQIRRLFKIKTWVHCIGQCWSGADLKKS